jgi:hypothetical protein
MLWRVVQRAKSIFPTTREATRIFLIAHGGCAGCGG